MTDKPLFQEPVQPRQPSPAVPPEQVRPDELYQRSSGRNTDRPTRRGRVRPVGPKVYTAEGLKARFADLDKRDRRCAADVACTNAANRVLTVQPRADDGTDVGEMFTVQCCLDHRALWTNDPRYRVVAMDRLENPIDPPTEGDPS